MEKIIKNISISKLIFCGVLILFCIFVLVNFEEKDVLLTGESFQADNSIGGIYEGDVLEQYVSAKSNDLMGFEIKFGTYGRYNNNLVRVTFNENDEVLYEWQFGADVLKDSEYTTFIFPEKLTNVKGNQYTVKIETDSKKTENNNITIYTTLEENKINENELYHKGILKEKTLDIKTISSCISGKRIKIFAICICVVIMIISIYCGFSTKLPLYKKYLIFASIVGVLYLSILPYGVGPDESKHIMRIFEISEGHMLSDRMENGAGGRMMADNLVPFDTVTSYSDMGTYLNAELDYNNKVDYTFGNTALYSPISYIPQVIATWVANIFSDKTIIIAYACKLAGLVFGILLMLLAIKYLPIKKECLLLIALMPMFMQQLVVITADGFVNVLAISFITLIVYLSYVYKEKIKSYHIILLFILMIIIGLCKIVFLPLSLLIFMIPKDKYESCKKYWITSLTSMIVTCVANLTWLSISASYLYEVRKGVNGQQQVINVLSHPFNYLNVIYNTLLEKHEIIFWEFFGDGLGALNIHVNRIVYYFMATLLMILIISKYDEIEIKLKDKIIMLLAFWGSVMLIFTSEYVQWTKVGADVIEGIQGRYFIPVILLLCICLENRKLKLEKGELQKYLFPFLGYVNLFALVSCLQALI